MTLVVPGPMDLEEPRGRFTRIVHVRAPRSPVLDDRYRVILPHRFLFPASSLWRILDLAEPDLVEVCDKYSLCYFAGLIRRRRARPTLVGLSCERLDDSLRAYVGGGRTSRVAAAAFLGRAYIGMFDAHVANSDYTADELRRAMRPPHIRPVHVSPMGIERPSPLHPHVRASIRRKLLTRSGAVDGDLLLYAGRLSPEKNVEVPGPVREALREQAAALREAIEHGSGVYFPKRAHGVRIDAKKLRYVLEMTNDPEAIAPDGLKALKKVQEVLGSLHDREVLRERFARLAENDESGSSVAEALAAIDADCEQRFASYVTRRAALMEVCDAVETFASSTPRRFVRAGSLLRVASMALPVVAVLAVRAGAARAACTDMTRTVR